MDGVKSAMEDVEEAKHTNDTQVSILGRSSARAIFGSDLLQSSSTAK